MANHIKVLNLPRELCHLILGREHKPHHRMIAGGVVMVCGVLVAKSAHAASLETTKVFLDLTGYFIHGLGAVPFVEWLLLEEAGDSPPPAFPKIDPE